VTDPLPAHEVERLKAAQGLLGHKFKEPALLRLALTHASAKAAGLPSNERLEYLGDSVLGLIVSEYLYRVLPDAAEGDLTRTRSNVVSSRGLARACREVGLHEYFTLGKGIRSVKTLPQSLLANVMEAVLGAVYLDAGLETARETALRLLKGEIESALAGQSARNFKALLQHLAQTELRTTPTYRVVSEEGPAHTRTFAVVAVIGRREFPAARGRSKKTAEQGAARKAWKVLDEERKQPGNGKVSANGAATPAKRGTKKKQSKRKAAPKSDKTAKAEKTDKATKPEKPEKPEKSEKPAKPAKPPKSVKIAKSPKAEKPAKPK
jgi:ribonuclease-3